MIQNEKLLSRCCVCSAAQDLNYDVRKTQKVTDWAFFDYQSLLCIKHNTNISTSDPLHIRGYFCVKKNDDSTNMSMSRYGDMYPR